MNVWTGDWLSSRLEEGFSAHDIALLLWAGVGALTLALLVLSRTRWGEAKPLSKCVFLSLYAHFLLGGYAYTTQLIVEPPAPPREPVIRLTHVSQAADEQDSNPQERAASPVRSPAPWEQVADAAPMQPAPSAPERQEAPPVAEPTRTMEASVPSNLDLAPSDAPPIDELVERPAPAAPPAPKIAALASAAAPAKIEQPAVPTSPEETPADPQPELPGAPSLARAEAASPQMAPLPRRDPPASPQELLDVAGGVQRLADALPADLADAVRGDHDDLASSVNRSEGAPGSELTFSGSSATPRALGAAVAALPVPRRLGDGAVVPDLYRLRVGEGRSLAARRLGATPQTEAAVEAALRWFAAHQQADGRWSAAAHGAGREDQVLGHDRGGAGARADAAMTGLALLCFLGAGHTHLEGPYRQNVQRGLEFLLRIQQSDGDLSGDAEFFARMYCHGMASLALSEALALTGDQRLKPCVELAAAFSLACQHPTNGGWRYQKGDLGDMSQFGWQVMALKSAELAGVPIPQAAREGMYRFLRSASSGVHGGLASYRGGERVSRTMTAEALACRYFLDGEPGPNLRREAVGYILEEPPQAGRPNFYYWYYATLALFQTQDENWAAWSEALQEQLLARQRRDEGGDAGSWDPDCVWGGYGGRVYATAMACLCLEVYYRYLPITAK